MKVSAEGYETRVSPVVGVGPAVTDLDVALDPSNDYYAPVATDDLISIGEDSGEILIDVLANDIFVELTAIEAANASNGTVTCSLNGCVFQPAPGFSGDAGFSYTIIDPLANASSAEVKIVVTPVNDPPTITDFAATATIAGDPVTLGWRDHISDPDGDSLSLVSFEITTGPGELAVVEGDLLYYPPTDESSGQQTSAILTVSDPGGLTDSAQVVIDLLPPAEPAACASIDLTFAQPELWNTATKNTSSVTVSTLECSVYEVHLESSDPGHEIGYQIDQNEEQWYLEGLNSDGQVIYTSAPTGDLPEDAKSASFNVGVADLTGVVAFRAHHVGTGTAINSIHVKATLKPQA